MEISWFALTGGFQRMEFYQGPDRTQGRVSEAEFKDYVYWEPRFF